MQRSIFLLFIVSAAVQVFEVSAQSKDITTFKCLNKNGSYSTIIRRGGNETPPMLVYNKVIANLSPKQRCEVISQRFTKAVAENGNKLRDLQLTHGILNNSPVICYINDSFKPCSDRSLLLTLQPKDRGREIEILTQMVTIGNGNLTPPIYQTENQVFVKFGEEVERLLESTKKKPNP
jgi:hypothetical protein